jgi:hypothetical protein
MNVRTDATSAVAHLDGGHRDNKVQPAAVAGVQTANARQVHRKANNASKMLAALTAAAQRAHTGGGEHRALRGDEERRVAIDRRLQLDRVLGLKRLG